MLPQLGFAEMIVLALLAIIVVGPKDLPKLMRSFGAIMAKVRGLGQEFKDAFDEMGAEDEIAEMRKELEDLKSMGSMKNLTGDLEGEMRALDRDLRSAGEAKPKSNPKSQKTEPPKTDPKSNPKSLEKPASTSKASSKPSPKTSPKPSPKPSKTKSARVTGSEDTSEPKT